MAKKKETQETAIQMLTEEQLPVSSEVLDGLVVQISEAVRQAPLYLALSVGKLIVDGLYGGDLTAWRDRGPKDLSFRKLAEHPGLETAGISPPVLYRSVAIYELAERHNGVSTWKHLGVSHVRAVLSLPEPQQEKLLAVGEEKHWTVEKMESEAAKVRKKLVRSAGGRPSLPTFVKSLNRLARYANGEDMLVTDLDQVESLSIDSRKKLEEMIVSLQQRLETVRAKLVSTET